MNKQTATALLILGGIVLFVGSAVAAVVIRPRPTPIVAPIDDPTPAPIVSAN